MKIYKKYSSNVNENKVQLDTKVPDLRDEYEKHIILTVTDRDDNLLNLLNHIKSVANMGHSFTIVADPGSEGEEKFYIDGDGMDHIHDITTDKYKEKD